MPFAVVAGWALGAPAAHPATLGATDSLDGVLGDGGLGSAPQEAARPRDTAGYTARPPRATADPASSQPVPATGPSTVTSTVTVVASATAPSPTRTTDPPLLTLPPVPTPTFVTEPPGPTETPPAPSATGSPASSFPPGFGPVGESRRWLWG
ncbi:hypothetical protein QLQ12_35465 [Actinoplanes sp. NEAU-A12]|uniref:Uncharacterized protein n=1 Tax=Actinoplanes sandaracinus TaxID=3045177 RepID=A0ABT6WW02_9ACTN|nr:hypothetical protein [Actinoplanes sandaracinus]MDI6103927.1 hypothetical protein [Actinoplanes sandaracinus]